MSKPERIFHLCVSFIFIGISCNALVGAWHEITKPEMVFDWQFYGIFVPLLLFIELIGLTGAWKAFQIFRTGKLC